MRRALLFAAILLVAAHPVFGAGGDGSADKPLPMGARFLEKSARTGDVVTLLLSFELPPGGALLGMLRVKGLPEAGVGDMERDPEGLRIKLVAAGLDQFEVGPLTLDFRTKDGGQGRFRSEPVSLPLTSTLPRDPEKARVGPLKGILPVTPWWRKILPWALAGAGAVLISAILVFLILRLSKKKPGAAVQDVHDTAEAALDDLAAREPQLTDKVFYFELTLIIRSLMGMLRGFPAAEMTPEEIASRARDEEDRDMLRLLREAEWVKFADRRATEFRRKEHLQAARDWVLITRPLAGPGQDGKKGEA